MESIHTRGSLVWLLDPQAGWIKGEVLALEGSQLRVRTEAGDVRLCSPADCPLQNPTSRMGVEVRPWRHSSLIGPLCGSLAARAACGSCTSTHQQALRPAHPNNAGAGVRAAGLRLAQHGTLSFCMFAEALCVMQRPGAANPLICAEVCAAVAVSA